MRLIHPLRPLLKLWRAKRLRFSFKPQWAQRYTQRTQSKYSVKSYLWSIKDDGLPAVDKYAVFGMITDGPG